MHQLAIVIPYFKLTFFRETLESLASQTDQRFHVYIGNDASLENPDELLEEFEGKFNFTYKRFDENLGGISLTKQWERCIDMMQGEEWFMILGDDDFLGCDVVSEFYLQLLQLKIDTNIIRYSLQIIDQHSIPIRELITSPKFENSIDSHFKKLSGLTSGSLSEHIFRTRAYYKHGFKDYPLAWGSDNRAIIDISEGNDIYSINNAIVYFRLSNINISGNTNANQLIKIESLILQRRMLFKDYKNLMSASQKNIFLNIYEDDLFTKKKITRKELLEIVTWTFLFRTYSDFTRVMKIILYRLLN